MWMSFRGMGERPRSEERRFLASTIWGYLVQNKCMERNVFQVMDMLRNLKLALQEFNPDPDFGDDPVKFMAQQIASIDALMQQIPGWRTIQNYDIPN